MSALENAKRDRVTRTTSFSDTPKSEATGQSWSQPNTAQLPACEGNPKDDSPVQQRFKPGRTPHAKLRKTKQKLHKLRFHQLLCAPLDHVVNDHTKCLFIPTSSPSSNTTCDEA